MIVCGHPIMKPKLALCNIFQDNGRLRQFAFKHGFSGIDWSFDINQLPRTPKQVSDWIKGIEDLHPFETRYHCPFQQLDLGHTNPEEARKADTIFRHIIRMVAEAGGKYLTIHVGLGHDSTKPLSWGTTLENLRRIVQYGSASGINICLENLAWGWTARPNLFEKMIRKSGAGVTFDIGHAHACESIQSRQYDLEDFVSPHEGNVLNAHIYHTEVSGLGHVPPAGIEDIRDRLDLLKKTGCRWWAIEIKGPNSLVQTKQFIDSYWSDPASTGCADNFIPAVSC